MCADKISRILGRFARKLMLVTNIHAYSFIWNQWKNKKWTRGIQLNLGILGKNQFEKSSFGEKTQRQLTLRALLTF